MKKSKYERIQRNYSIAGVTSAFRGFFRPEFVELYGGTLKEIIGVQRDGVFYHFETPQDLVRVSKLYITKVKENKIDLNKTYKLYSAQISRYEKHISIPEKNYTTQTLLKFYEYYETLMPVAFAVIGSLDVMDELSSSMQNKVKSWAIRTRKRGELIYKKGEMVFLPKYLSWLASTILPQYTQDELSNCVSYELENFINNEKPPPSPSQLRKRNKLFFVRHHPPQRIEYFSGQAAQKQIDNRYLFSDLKRGYRDIRQISGASAYHGKVKGKVRLIRSRHDIKEFKKGEILVSTMTDPSYISIMKKSSAIITDEGGVLSHAAIVSREFGIPCVVGTKISTRVFKDGDMVEVNANHGVVRKI